jgi:hypothetical protein
MFIADKPSSIPESLAIWVMVAPWLTCINSSLGEASGYTQAQA